MTTKLRKIKSAIRKVQRKVAPATVPQYGYSGDYKNWEEVVKASSSYETEHILTKVSTSLAKVRDGQAIYERDSYLFDEIQYAWPLLSCLQRVGLESNNELNLIDFGGSLGSTYYQNKSFLEGQLKLNWNIVEQKLFVDHGQKEFQNKDLKFHPDIDSALNIDTSINTLLVSGTIQYLSQPYMLLNEWLKKDFKYIIFDRTSFYEGNRDRLSLQKVPPHIYSASYPAWFFNEQKFLEPILKSYNMICKWEALAGCIPIHNPDGSHDTGIDKGFLFVKKS